MAWFSSGLVSVPSDSARQLPGGSASSSQATIDPGWSESSIWPMMPSSISATGWLKSSVLAAPRRIVSGSRTSASI